MERNIGRENHTSIVTNVKSAGPDFVTQLKDIFFLCIKHWWWFVLSLAITMSYAALKIKRTTPVYIRTASILIKSEDKNSETSELVELGLVKKSTNNITNEILSLKTGSVADEVVRRLNLDVEYFKRGTFHDEVVYGLDLPVNVSFIGMNDNDDAEFNLEKKENGTIVASGWKFNGNLLEGKTELRLHDTIQSPVGWLTVVPTRRFDEYSTFELIVYRHKKRDISSSVQWRIWAGLRDQNASIIDVSFRDASIARAEDVLNTLVAVYNENWIKNRNQKTVNTNKFIKDRLAFIEQELSDVEQEISDWKSRNLILDVGSAGGAAMGEANEAEQALRELENQMYMTRFVRNYLIDGQHENQLLPNNLGMTNPSIGGQITEYNTLLLQRNNHLANSSLQNPLVMDMDEQLVNMRNSIIQSLDYELTILQARQDNIRGTYKEAVAKITTNPQQSQYLLSVERQQKVKEELYLFLLQKREENELSQAFAAYNSQLIETPYGSNVPIEPEPNKILMMAFLLGIAVPAGAIMAIEMLNTKVRGRNDLEQLNIPFVGDIPLSGGKKGFLHNLTLKRNKPKTIPQVIVIDKNRNIMNEAFRVVRTNMEFMLGFDNRHHVVMLTSVNPGSGKTFITANLSAALGIKGKKVLAIDLDLRKGSLSEYVGNPRKGVSNYLGGQEVDYKSLIVPLGTVDIMPCGKIPPNPTELLFTERFQQMLEEVRSEYDYVFIDCPPVEIVADAAIITQYCDLTLFVVRAGVLERAFLPDILFWYENKKYGNLSLLLNGSTESSGRYGYHRYGYHYGTYGYGQTE